MDPFAPDSDPEEDSEHPLSASQRVEHLSRLSSRSNNLDAVITNPQINDAVLEDDDEEPPPSILLASPNNHTTINANAAISSLAQHGPSLHQSRHAEAGPSNLRESVRLGSMSRAGNAASLYEDNRDEASEGDEDDELRDIEEEIGLLNEPRQSSASSSSSSGRKRDKGLFHTLARKVRKRAAKVQAENGVSGRTNGKKKGASGLNARDRALWEWGTRENMDEFLQEVYTYYVGKGLFCIALTKALNLLTIAFVIGFSTFLVGCVDYQQIQHDGKLSDVIVGQCVSRFSGFYFLAFLIFMALYGWQVVRFGLGFSRLVSMSHFYSHLLNIPDADVQSIPWHEVVARLSHLRETYPNTSISSSRSGNRPTESKMDAHDVANRIMRQENYLVALFNKDVLDLRLPFPGFQSRPPELTKTLEWNLSFCLLGFLFDSKGQVRRQFLTDRHRKDLIEGLRRRFIFMAIINAIFAPFIVLYLLFYSFFRYFEEYHKNPSTLGSRQYTQLARWKLREFNELPHLFRRRCHNSYPFAHRYIDQFPKERIAIVARFVSFVAGSFTAVLLLASVIDPDLFLHFDISPQRNVLFYIGIFGAITAVARGMVPDEQQVFEPEVLLRGVIEHTHYLPEQWKGRFHSAQVHVEFGSMYKLKIYIFLSEIMSVIFTPFILWKTLPDSAPAIIDFFREFTVHVDGLGYVCSFAIFDFRRHGNVKFGAPEGNGDERLSSKEGKMEQSLLGFRAANPTWQPSDPSASLFLSRLAAMDPSSPPYRSNRGISQQPSLGQAMNPATHNYNSTNNSTTTNNRGQSPGRNGGPNSNNNPISFTPANSTLAQRSQLYTEAFEKSISLATKPSNALALQASAIKTGNRSVAAKTLQAVSEDLRDDTEEEDDDEFDPNSNSAYEDARPDANHKNNKNQQQNFNQLEENNSHDQVNLRGLLQHIGSRW